MQHQFNLGSAVQPPPFIPKQDPAAPMFASVDGVAVPLSDEEVVFQTRGRDEAQVLTTQVLLTMDHCRPFRSLDEHVAEVIRKVPGLANPEGARKGLELLARNGLLVSDADFLERSRQARLEPAPLAALCIRACDRPDSVRRLLASLAESYARHGTPHPVMLLDDSRSEEAARENARLLRAFGDDTGATVHYVGEREQAQLKKQLLGAMPEHEAAIDGLLDRPAQGFGGGRNWNVALLLTAGRRLFMLDEDYVLPLKMHPDMRPGMDLTPGASAGAWFYPDTEAALAAGSAAPHDPVAMHLDVVGHALGDVASRGDWRVDREDLRGIGLRDLRGLEQGYRVLASCNGTRGSNGMASSQPMFLLDADSRARLVASREDYLRNLAGDAMWHGYTRAHPVWQNYMTPFALDNSQLLPCTRTGGRNEDALFNTLARFCYPDSQALRLPCTVGHAQEPGRGRGMKRIGEQAWQVNVNTFAYETLLNHMERCMSADPARRMAYAADIFEDVASADRSRRIAHLREFLNFERGDMIARLQRELTTARGAPVYWQSDIRALIEANARAMAANNPPRFSDWREDIDAAACAERLSEALGDLARELRAWPDLWQWARERGERLLDSL